MSSRFTALPLSSGEAFVLETVHGGKRKVILVDAGQSKGKGAKKNRLYKAIRKNCPNVKDRIDIAICTHSDHDHSGGFPSFIETWHHEGHDIGEIWLPALWSPAVRGALINPDLLLARLSNGAGQAALQIMQHERELSGDVTLTGSNFARKAPALTLDEHIRHLGKRSLEANADIAATAFADGTEQDGEESREEQVARSWGFDADELDAVRSSLEESEILTASLRERSTTADRDLVLLRDEEPALLRSPEWHLKRTLLSNVIETADAIREVSAAAINAGIPVRWFDFTPFESGLAAAGGLPGFLVPLNTVERRQPLRAENSLALFYSLKLTEQNVSSLVFQRVETKTEPSVIFVADSRLAFGVNRPERDFPNHLSTISRPCIYTSAHHGSRNNDRAYEVLEKWLDSALFKSSLAVRNGGVWNQTLAGYLKVKNRRCAQCYQCHGGDWAQLVSVVTKRARWMLPPDQGGKCGTPKRSRRKRHRGR